MAKVRVIIRLRKEILDAEGQTIAEAVERNGFGALENCRVGQVIEFDVPADYGDREAALQKIDALCDKVLVNPVMQDYEIEWL